MKKQKHGKNILILLTAIIGIIGLKTAIDVYNYDTSKIFFVIGYRGPENLFHVPYQYYGVNSRNQCYQVSTKIIEKNYPKEKNDYYSMYQDKNSFYYQVSLTKTLADVTASSTRFINQSSFPDKKLLYRADTRNTQENTKELSEETEKELIRITKEFLPIFQKEGGDFTCESLDYLAILHEGQWILKPDFNHGIYYYNGKTMKYLMTIPKHASFDYIIWKRE